MAQKLNIARAKKNGVADAIYCFDMNDNKKILNISELYGYNDDDLPDSAYPIRYCDIAKSQKTDAKIQ